MCVCVNVGFVWICRCVGLKPKKNHTQPITHTNKPSRRHALPKRYECVQRRKKTDKTALLLGRHCYILIAFLLFQSEHFVVWLWEYISFTEWMDGTQTVFNIEWNGHKHTEPLAVQSFNVTMKKRHWDRDGRERVRRVTLAMAARQKTTTTTTKNRRKHTQTSDFFSLLILRALCILHGVSYLS